MVTNVTSATPFACNSPVTGAVPQLKVTLTINPATATSDQTTATDYITMRNATAGQCS
jgi:hypothetical protein